MTTDERRWAPPSPPFTKKPNILLSQSNPPPSRSGTAVEKHAVRCAQQVSANSSESLLNKPKAPLSLLCLHWRGIKSENADTWKKSSEAWWRDQVEFLPYWFGASVPCWMCWSCLISYSRPSLRQRSGQVGCKEPSGSLLWWKASSCHTNLIGWCLIAALRLDGALVNCNQSWSVGWVRI